MINLRRILILMVGMVLSCAGGSEPAAQRGIAGSGQAVVKFLFPLVCTINSDCFFANYIDHQAGPGLQDYQCGPITYNGHRGIDITLPSFRLMDRGIYVVAAAEGTVVELQDGWFDRNKRAGSGGYGNALPVLGPSQECEARRCRQGGILHAQRPIVSRV
jgi:hypothetical protein